jgi:Zn-dependent protease with chaperone function
MFDEMIAFTLAHELSHHYLGHTSCAHGQTPGISPDWMELGRLLSSAVPLFNQPNELAADASGCVNVLDAGRLRASHAYPWTEEGGVFLLDFFFRVEQASGDSPALAFFSTHPDPALRIPILQRVAGMWRQSHGS